MGIRIEDQGRSEGRTRWPAYSLLTIVMLTAVFGCGTRNTEQASQSKAESPAPEERRAGSPTETVVANAPEPAPALPPSKPAESTYRVNLSETGCIRFEPQWTRVRVGESITWHSDLESTVRIYVSPGVFARNEFVVRPGASISTGPARSSGRYSFWTEPSACRDMPKGVLLSGPGVMVEETFYASAPGVR